MSHDTIASLQYMQQLEQSQATSSKRLILKRVNSPLDIWIIVLACLLFIPTIGFSLLLAPFIYFGKEFFTKTYMVKNIATGEKFKAYKQDFKEYKKTVKEKKKQVRDISDLETTVAKFAKTSEPTLEIIKKEEINVHVKESKINEKETISEQHAFDPIPISPTLPVQAETNNTLTFNVAGVTFENDKGKDIQPLLKRIARAIAKENYIDAYGGYTNKELLEIWGEASEFEDVEFGDYISFVKDPDNKFDKNAIKAIVNLNEKEFHIGHVPKKQNIEVGKLLDSESIISISAKFIGGKTKSVDYDDEKDKDVVVINERTLGVLITLRCQTEAE